MPLEEGVGDTGDETNDWDRHWRDFAASLKTNPAQHFRQRLVLRMLANDDPSRLLDIGSGTGELAVELQRTFPRAAIVGLELSSVGIDIARQKLPEGRFVHRDLSMAGVPSEDLRDWATHAVCSEVLEHVDDPVALLRNARAYMAPGCRIVVTVPGGPMSSFDRHIGHRRHYSPESLAETLSLAGLTVELSTGAGFPGFNVYRLTVIGLGRRLIDVARAGHTPSRTTRLGTRMFDQLLSGDARLSRRGWQVVALAVTPGGAADTSD